MLLGASGSGKSTLVDAFINFVADVSYAENFRFKITDNEGNGTSVGYVVLLQYYEIVFFSITNFTSVNIIYTRTDMLTGVG